MTQEKLKSFFNQEFHIPLIPVRSSAVFQALNEIVVERGPNSNLVRLDVFTNSNFICTIAGDGVIISTPTGSTAYSMASGGSIIHTDVPCICMTPVCPFSLSSRPLILPEYSLITIKVNPNSRVAPQVTIDGCNSFPLNKDDVLVIQMSELDVPSTLSFGCLF